MKRLAILVALGVLAVAGAVGGVAWATGAGGKEPLTGDARERAIDAALEHTKGGTATETETGDGGAAYEVEVRLDDGSQVEVQLDESFAVIGDEPDDDGANDQEGAGDDE